MTIQINITDKRPTVIGSPVIVCGNGGYTIEFAFDAEWEGVGPKTARFVYTKDGVIKHQDVAFSGNTVEVPVLSGITAVFVGVYTAAMQTTTPARIPCELSIRCNSGEGVGEITPSQYDQIMALFMGIPTITAEDEGKFLRVVAGTPDWVAIAAAESEAF